MNDSLLFIHDDEKYLIEETEKNVYNYNALYFQGIRERVCQSHITFKLVARNYVIGVMSLNFEFI